MSRNWTREELADALARNPGLRVATEPLASVANRQPSKVAAQPDFGRAATKPEWSETQFPTSTKPGNGLHELMATPAYQGMLQPEEALSVAVATELRRLTHQGKLRAVWSRLPLEHPEGGRYGMAAQCKRIAMGGVPGAPDFWFAWGTGSGLIELKVNNPQASLLTPSGKLGIRKGRRTYLNGRQKLFAEWCKTHGVKHAVCRSVDEVKEKLREWGLLA
jgi:hypothetical protein